MSRIPRMIKHVEETLADATCEIIDDSAAHAGHQGVRDGIPTTEETHLHLIVTSKYLSELPKVTAHRELMRTCQAEFDSGLHALKITIQAGTESK